MTDLGALVAAWRAVLTDDGRIDPQTALRCAIHLGVDGHLSMAEQSGFEWPGNPHALDHVSAYALAVMDLVAELNR